MKGDGIEASLQSIWNDKTCFFLGHSKTRRRLLLNILLNNFLCISRAKLFSKHLYGIRPPFKTCPFHKWILQRPEIFSDLVPVKTCFCDSNQCREIWSFLSDSTGIPKVFVNHDFFLLWSESKANCLRRNDQLHHLIREVFLSLIFRSFPCVVFATSLFSSHPKIDNMKWWGKIAISSSGPDDTLYDPSPKLKCCENFCLESCDNGKLP